MFYAELERLAHDLAGRDELIDYAGRRDQCRNLVSVPDEPWRMVCAKAGIVQTMHGGRRRFCAVWLWAELTSGDPLRTPGMVNDGGNPGHVRGHRRRLLNKDLERLEAVLQKVAEVVDITSYD